MNDRELVEIYEHFIRLLDNDRRFIMARSIEWSGQLHISVVGDGITRQQAYQYFREMLPPEVKIEIPENTRTTIMVEFPFDLGKAIEGEDDKWKRTRT